MGSVRIPSLGNVGLHFSIGSAERGKGDFVASAVVGALLSGRDPLAPSSSQENSLSQDLGGKNFQEFLSLSQERDPDLFTHGLLILGDRLAAQDRLDWALKVYGAVQQIGMDGIAHQAQQRIQAVLGQGAVRGRTEFLLRRFVKEATDFKTIVPMLVGTSVAHLVKTITLSKLAVAGGEAWYARRMGAKLVSNALAYIAEVPTFALTGRALRRIGPVDPNVKEPSMGQELASAATVLGLLKAFSSIGNQVHGKLHGINEAGEVTRLERMAKFTQGAIGQASMFFGLLAARQAEERFGLRRPTDDATSVIDTLGAMLSMGVGARLGSKVLGEGVARWNFEMTVRTERRAARLKPALSFLTSPLLSPMWMMLGTGGIGGGMLGGRSFSRLRVEFSERQIIDDLISIASDYNPFAGKIPRLSRRMETRFEYGDFIEWKSRKNKNQYTWKSALNGESLEPATPEEYQTYLAWRSEASLPKEFPLRRNSSEILDLKRQLERNRVSLHLEGKVTGAQIAYVRAVLRLLPDEFYHNNYVRRISLGIPNSKNLWASDHFHHGNVRISQATLRGSRRMLAATLLHELGHSVDVRYSASLSELGSSFVVDPDLGPPLLPDLSIPIDVRRKMHEHFEAIRARPENAFVMNVLADSGQGRWELVGFPRRRAYILGSFREFIADFVLYYIAGGSKLRRFIQSPAQVDGVKNAYLGIYEEIRERIFGGWQYDGRGPVSPESEVQEAIISK